MPIKLVPANAYSIEELTEAYNQTRVDYMVPMPMNVARLTEYIHVYDVHLDKSLVALENGKMFGLGMLGIRPERSWITRLGLIADQRGKGIGQALMEGLLEISDEIGIPRNILEVIYGNKPAHNLFLKLGFEEVRELLILRRAPHDVPEPSGKRIEMNRGEIIFHLNQRNITPAWTNQTESLAHAKGVCGFHVYTPSGGHGWLVYQRTLFNLSRLMYGFIEGSPCDVMRELLRHLHSQYPDVDTYTENIPADEPCLQAFEENNYIEAFRRIEMQRFPKL